MEQDALPELEDDELPDEDEVDGPIVYPCADCLERPCICDPETM